MANTTISPNMSLPLPTIGQDPGPDYALNVNASLTLLDQHDHSFGKGVQITPSGMNINSTLSLNNNILSIAQAVTFQAQSAASTLPQGLSVAPGGESPPQQDLFYTPNTGIPIQITKNGIVNATVASIPGESYAAGTFFWTQTQDSLPTNPASFDIGQITLRPNISSTSFGVTLVPPSTSTYNFVFPGSLPASTKFLTIDNAGNVGDNTDVDNSTIVITSNTIKVPSGGITTTQIANQGVQTANIQDGAVTQVKRAPLGIQVSRQFSFNKTIASSTGSTLTSDITVNSFSSPNITIGGPSPAAQQVSVNDPVTFTTSGTLPSGIVLGVTYFVLTASSITHIITISATMGGATLTFTGAGTGVATAHFNNVLVNIPSTGRPIAISFQAGFQGSASIDLNSGSSTNGFQLQVIKTLPTVAVIATIQTGTNTSLDFVAPSAYNTIDYNTTIDNYQYQLGVFNAAGVSITATITGVLVAYEL